MTIRRQIFAAALASACSFAMTCAFAEPVNPEQDCDDLMTELKDLNGTLLQGRSAARTPMAVCGAIGQLLGVAKAARAVADECYDDEKKRQEQVALYEKATKDLQGQLGATCK